MIGKVLGDIKHNDLIFGCVYDHGDGVKWSESVDTAPSGANVIQGVIIHIENVGSRFVPAEKLEGSEKIVPGQRMVSANGEFIPGASIRSEAGKLQFIPGVLDEGDLAFHAGQFVLDEEKHGQVKFVKGQIVHTPQGTKFVEGETIATPDGMKFVAG